MIKIDKEMDKLKEISADRQTDRQTDRPLHTHAWMQCMTVCGVKVSHMQFLAAKSL